MQYYEILLVLWLFSLDYEMSCIWFDSSPISGGCRAGGVWGAFGLCDPGRARPVVRRRLNNLCIASVNWYKALCFS